MTVLKNIEVVRFRNLPKGTYPLGKRITIVTGQNATGKSTLLGMIAQPFGSDEKDIWDKPLRAKFSEIFKLSTKFDKPQSHEYQINLFDDSLHPEGASVRVKSFKRDEESYVRLVTGKSRGKGTGNIDIPVCYLGLKRVFPLGETSNPQIEDHKLTPEEANDFIHWHRQILLETDNTINPQEFSSKSEKNTLGIYTNSYDSMTISAGQDNIGQILGALISLKRYKEKAGRSYKGALLIIDEVDVTLHAASQKKLAEFLLEKARGLNIQIVVSTHSLYFIESIEQLHSIGRNDSAIWHMSCPKGETVFELNPSTQNIRRSIYLTQETAPSPQKINVYLEDNEAVLFLKTLLPRDIKRRVNIIAIHSGFQTVRSLAKTVNEIGLAICILDGDEQRQEGDADNLMVLPGKDSVERIFLQYLGNLPANDEFWNTNYLKQNFMSNNTLPITPDRRRLKTWFNNEKKHWGRSISRLYKRWGKDNLDEIEIFRDDFKKIFNEIAKKLGLPMLDA